MEPVDVMVTDIRLIDGNCSLKASVDIWVGGITIRGFKIVHEKGKDRWISAPEFSWVDQTTGKVKYKAVVECSKLLKDKIDEVIFEAYDGVAA